MSGFAERLVARSAGTPAAGISVLAPRPVSPFEPTAGIEIEGMSEAVSPAIPPGISLETEPMPIAAATAYESQMSPGAAPTIFALPAQDSTPIPPDRGDAGGSVAATETDRAQARETRREDIAYRKANTEVVVRTAVAQAPAARSLPPAVSDRSGEIELAHSGQSSAFPVVPIMPTELESTAKAEPAAPMISIGKIEVQFLPQETHIQPARAAPERTRGFAAYARARRGEPR
jgi:hypothetical protein